MQARGGGADQHALASQIRQTGGLRLLRFEIERVVRNARERLAVPVQANGLVVRHRPASRFSDAPWQRWQRPALMRVIDPVTAANAVGIGQKIDQTGAPAGRVDGFRRDQRQAGVRDGAGTGANFHQRRQLAQGAGLAVAGDDERQDGTGRDHRVAEDGIAGRPENVWFAENEIESNRRRFLPVDEIDQFAMNGARPRPVAGKIEHLRMIEAGLVDIDEDDLGGGLPVADLPAQQHIAATGIQVGESIEIFADTEAGEQQADEQRGEPVRWGARHSLIPSVRSLRWPRRWRRAARD